MTNLLLVDDEVLTCEWLAHNIRSHSDRYHIVGCCKNGNEALEAMEREPPDILITDIKMPVMNGIELVRRVKALDPNVICVVLTNFANFDYARDILPYNGVEYILKSELKGGALVEVLDRLIATHGNSGDEKAPDNLPRKDLDAVYRELVEGLEQDLPFQARDAFARLMDAVGTGDAPFGESARFLCMKLELELRERLIKMGIVPQADWMDTGSPDGCRQNLSLLLESCLDAGNTGESLSVQVKQYIEQNYAKDISLADLSDELAVSREHISRTFRKETGESLSNYLMLYRLHRARELFEDKSLSLSEIAHRVGYPSEGYFSRLYRKHLGKIPKRKK